MYVELAKFQLHRLQSSKMDKKLENIVRHADVSEKAIERYLTNGVKTLGGICLKYSNAGMVGFPDRVCLLPGGVTIWVELKSKGESPKAIQQVRFSQMAKIGHRVYVCDSKEKVDEVLDEYRKFKDL